MKKPQQPNERFTKTLPVRLTDDELRIRGEALAAQLQRLDDIEAQLQRARDATKGPRQETVEMIGELRRQISTKSEDRPVDCEEIKDYTKRCADTIRLDIGEVVYTRPLSALERQVEITAIDGGREVG